MQEQLAKIQQDMRDQMLEFQRNMMSQLTQLLTRGLDKGKSPMVNIGDDNEDPAYPPGFTPTNIQAQPNTYPQRTGTSAPVNFPAGSGSNPRDNPANPVVPNLDDTTEMEKVRVELPKQLEDRCKWLEEKFKAFESADYHSGIEAKELSLVLDLVLPLKLKMPEFKKYNGTSCPEAHITMFCRRMTGYISNNHLTGAAAKWYNQLSRAQVNSWKDLAQAFMKQYGHVTDMALDKITLQNMEKKANVSFRRYA
ncbi:intersectin-1-like [Gossypium australe]|uniref:Intersectin-1-like n=1 Tax=Gossypium australe TaxID=47621 RepID=A0A5B6WP11_9ROSI|nr:intersectin-1-like [Gossypium australe]